MICVSLRKGKRGTNGQHNEGVNTQICGENTHSNDTPFVQELHRDENVIVAVSVFYDARWPCVE